MEKMKAYLDRIIAALIIAGCVGVLVFTLWPSDEQAVNSEKITDAVQAVNNAILRNKADKPGTKDYVGVYAANMKTAEGLLPPDRIAWKFWPQPPFVKGVTVEKDPVFHAALSRPVVSLGGVWVGKATINVSFGAGDENWQSRAILVWRKPAAAAEWPAEPVLTIKVGPGGAAALPANIAAVGGGYEIRLEDLRPREACEYRACTAAIFPAKVRRAVGSVEKDCELKPPENSADFLPAPGAINPVLGKLLVGDAQAGALLGAGPFVTRFSESVKVELPGDVQVRLAMMEQDEEGKYVRAAFSMRRWVQSLDKWVEKGMQRVDIGKDISGEAIERIDGKTVKFPMDADATLVELKVEMRKPPPVTRMVPKRDPNTGKPVQPMEMVPEEWVGPARRVQLAVVKDKRTGEKHELIAGPGEWWPEGLQIAPKQMGKDEPGPALPRPGVPAPAVPRPVLRPVVPAPAPMPPAPAPPVDRGAGKLPPPAPEGAAMGIDLSKPLPPDATEAMREAYERAKKDAELLKQQRESGELR